MLEHNSDLLVDFAVLLLYSSVLKATFVPDVVAVVKSTAICGCEIHH